MAIQNLDKNQTIRVYYRASEQIDTLDVRFDFFNTSGVYLSQNQPFDGLVTGKGIYYYDFTAPNEDIYILGLAYVGDNQDVEPIVFKIGQPAQQLLFYYTEKNIIGGLDYRIYDNFGVVLQDGQLSQVSDTYFWYVEFTPPLGATSEDDYFFEVDDTYSVQSFNPINVDTDLTYTATTITSIFNLNNIVISGSSVYASTNQASNFNLLAPVISGDAIIPVNCFEAVVSDQTGNSTQITTTCGNITANLFAPVISGDALVSVSVFDADSSVVQPNKIESQVLTGSLPTPVVKADCVINVNSILLACNVNSNVIATQSITVGVIDLNSNLKTPQVTASKVSPPTPKTGYPYDYHLSLGAAPGMPLGVVSGRTSRFITIQFKICKKDFICEEGIYQRESGKFNTKTLSVKNVTHKPKKTNISLREKISRHEGNGIKLRVTKFQKV